MSEWQPIETAPKDGTVILVWPAWWSQEAKNWRVGEARWREMKRAPRWEAPGSALGSEPTHWMPLPAPPQDR